MSSAAKTKSSKSGSAKASPPDTAPIVGTSKSSVGDEVVHPQFGDGTVTAIDGEKLTIKFADGRTKQIVDYYVKRRRQ